MPCYAWVDSQVTLAWIKAHASRWTPFVANRVSKIQSILPPDAWRYVKTHENPADLATRGITPGELESNSLWWEGPDWLSNPHFTSEKGEIIATTSLEQKRELSVHVLQAASEVSLFDRYSKLKTLIRITAYCLRFVKNAKLHHSLKLCKGKDLIQHLNTSELAQARRRLIWLSQHQFFAAEIHALKNKKKAPSHSTIEVFLSE